MQCKPLQLCRSICFLFATAWAVKGVIALTRLKYDEFRDVGMLVKVTRFNCVDATVRFLGSGHSTTEEWKNFIK